MSYKIRLGLFLGCLLLLVAVAGLIGCGIRTENTSYFYSPGWTAGGNIIFIKGLQSVSKDIIGSQTGSSYTESVTTMTAAGAGETFWFDVTGAPPHAMSCAPTGTEYVAYMDQQDGATGLFGKVIIRNIAAGTHSGLEKVELSFSPGIKSFDWSSDATRIVYCTTQEVRTIKLDSTGNTLVTAESNLSFVTWKYGARIAFVHGSPSILSLIYADGTGRLNLAAAASVTKPQISAGNTNEVLGIAGGSFCSVNVSGTPATTEVFAGFGGDLPRLNPAADTVTYSKAGESSGIYLLNLSAKTESKLK
ncbi:MAG: hypothetical protein PHG97_06965 [Candidatus Margulisbacteria bacterium]|nr:hypothetical protein [Candidatus Margulisiibacteriota bacterium]